MRRHFAPTKAITEQSSASIAVYRIIGVPDTNETILACIEVGGASGYVLDNGSFDDVVRNIRAVAVGETVCSPHVANLAFARVSALARHANERQKGSHLVISHLYQYGGKPEPLS